MTNPTYTPSDQNQCKIMISKGSNFIIHQTIRIQLHRPKMFILKEKQGNEVESRNSESPGKYIRRLDEHADPTKQSSMERIYDMGGVEMASNRAEELRKLGFGSGIHAKDDYDGDENRCE